MLTTNEDGCALASDVRLNKQGNKQDGDGDDEKNAKGTPPKSEGTYTEKR